MPNSPTAPILLVDDEPANLLALEAVLQDLGEPLERALSGEEAMRKLRDRDYAAVLLDVHMPGMDGFETARLIRAQRRSRQTPILFITADGSNMSAREAYALGAVDFLHKPIKTHLLKAKLGFFVELHRSRQELKNAQAELLAASEERYRTLFDSIDEGFCIIEMVQDGTGRYVDYVFLETNPAFTKHTGMEGVEGRRMRELVPDFDARWFELYGRVAATGEPLRMEDEVPAMSRWFDVSATRLGGPGSRKVAIVLKDITERKRAEADLRRLADELAESDRRKTEFLATLAHELRNPLAPISNGLHLMRMTPGDARAQEKARAMMERQVRQMVHLVDDLLDIARISRDKLELRRETLDLAQVLATAVETSMPVVNAGNHELVVRTSHDPLLVNGDRTRLAQVVSNLLNNAAKYTPHGGRIEVDARREGGDAVVAVKDTGIGIPHEELPAVFEMFTQVGRNRDRAQGGLGIGLALVKRLVALHGGRVEAHSDGPGLGSTFTVRVPLANVTPPSHPGHPQDGLQEGACCFRIMVVDDNVDAAESLAALLEMQGHETRVAHTGEAALELAREFRPHIAFLDIGMPGMDGYEVARRMRADEATRGTVLVALTGWGAQEDRARSKAAGFDHHLTKPASIESVETLLGKIAEAVEAA